MKQTGLCPFNFWCTRIEFLSVIRFSVYQNRSFVLKCQKHSKPFATDMHQQYEGRIKVNSLESIHTIHYVLFFAFGQRRFPRSFRILKCSINFEGNIFIDIFLMWRTPCSSSLRSIGTLLVPQAVPQPLLQCNHFRVPFRKYHKSEPGQESSIG